MDSKESGVTAATAKQYRAVLPRVTDLIRDALTLLAAKTQDEELDFLVLDAEDAFWQIPLHPSERRFYCGQLSPSQGTRYLAYTRTDQGSRGAHLSWTIALGLICRCAGGALLADRPHSKTKLQVYVDDPILAVAGTTHERRVQYTILIIVWQILGVSLSF